MSECSCRVLITTVFLAVLISPSNFTRTEVETIHSNGEEVALIVMKLEENPV